MKEKRRRQDQESRAFDVVPVALAEGGGGRGGGGGGGGDDVGNSGGGGDNNGSSGGDGGDGDSGKHQRNSASPANDSTDGESLVIVGKVEVSSGSGGGGGGGDGSGGPRQVGERLDREETDVAERPREPVTVSPSPAPKTDTLDSTTTWWPGMPTREELRRLVVGSEVEERRTLAALRDLEACLVEGGVAAAEESAAVPATAADPEVILDLAKMAFFPGGGRGSDPFCLASVEVFRIFLSLPWLVVLCVLRGCVRRCVTMLYVAFIGKSYFCPSFRCRRWLVVFPVALILNCPLSVSAGTPSECGVASAMKCRFRRGLCAHLVRYSFRVRPPPRSNL